MIAVEFVQAIDVLDRGDARRKRGGSI